MTGALTFNTYNLQTYSPVTNLGIITNTIKHTDVPGRDVALMALANSNLSVIPSNNYPSRKVSIGGVIKGSSQSDLDDRIDTFKAYFNGVDKNLDIAYGSNTRRYLATANAISVERNDKSYFATFNVEFVCSQPFGINTTATTALSATGRTGASYSDAHTFIGSAPYQLPTLTVTYTAVSGGGSYVAFSNSSNGQGITITDQTWVATDILEIDTKNKTVKKNGVEVDFIGAFPEFEPGARSFTYSDGFTTRTFNVTVAYNALYL